MSYNPPHGPPPPPYYGYPAPAPAGPAPGAFAYVPAPVMPVYPMYPQYPQPPPAPAPETSQPTYVTNYIYQQPPAPEVSQPMPVNQEDLIDWVPSNPKSAPLLANRAFVAGKEGHDGSPLWIIRSHHNGELIPGKLAVKHHSAYIPYAGREIPVHNISVFCAPPHAVHWLPASNGDIPAGAIPAGNTHNAEPLFIARVRHLRSVTPGKVHPSHQCAYISFGGTEVKYKNYEVLCRVGG